MNKTVFLLISTCLGLTLMIPGASASSPNPVTSSTTIEIHGSFPIVQAQFDICSHVPFAGSCQVGLALSEQYAQPLHIATRVPQELQPQAPGSTEVSVSPGPPNLVLNFMFSLNSRSYSYSVPLPRFAAPGTFVLNTIVDGSLNDSSVRVSSFRSVFALRVGFDLSLPLLPSVSLFTYGTDLLDFGSSAGLTVGQWFHVAVASAHSQVSGDGWYLAGSTAPISIKDQSLTDSGSNYAFSGWSGKGLGSYSGTQISPSLVANSPIQENAIWQATPQQSYPLTVPISSIWAAGILVIVGVIAVFVVIKRKSET